MPMKQILWACDFYEDSLSTLEIAADIAARAGATLHALHIMRPPSRHEKNLTGYLERKGALEARLEALAGEIAMRGLGVSYKIIES